MKIQGIRTRYGAKQPLHEIFSRLSPVCSSTVVISFGHPGWYYNNAGRQSREESDLLMEEFFQDSNIRDVFLEGKYAFTKWENGAFSRYVQNIVFSESYLVWLPEKNQEDGAHLFHKMNWSLAFFAYEGMLFYEIFDRTGSVVKSDGENDIEYPGDINGPGGIGIPT